MPKQALTSACIPSTNVIRYLITPETKSLVIAPDVQHEAGWQAQSDAYKLAVNDGYHSEMKNNDVISTSDIIFTIDKHNTHK
jgi:hypothetical protein